jgi:site-specific DNA recombinase
VVWTDHILMGRHEPLITKDLFERVQFVLGGQKRPKTRKFAFRGLTLCGHCGSSMTAETKVKRQKNGNRHEYVYYHCTGWENNGKVCKGSYVSESNLIEQLGEPLKSLKIDVQAVDEIKAALKESLGAEREYHSSRRAALQSEETRLKGWIDKAYRDRLDELIKPEEYKEKSFEWRKRLVEIQNEVRAHQNADANYLDESSRILDLAHRAHEVYEAETDNHLKRQLVDLMVSKVVVREGRAVSNLREPFSALSKLASAAKSTERGSEWWAREESNLHGGEPTRS